MKKIIQIFSTINNNVNMQSRKWFLVSYFGVLIIFFTMISKLLNIINHLMIAPILGLIGVIIMFIGVLIYIMFIIAGFLLGRILKKHSQYLAKGFSYGATTVLILTFLLYVIAKYDLLK